MSLLRTAVLRASAAPRLATRAASTSSIHVVSSRSNETAPLLANIEASWSKLPSAEQFEVYQQLEDIQKKDWNELTVDEKKAAYFVAFGPHGPRAPVNPPGNTIKVFAGTLAAVGVALGLFALARSRAPPPVNTWNKEYQEQMTEYMQAQKSDPITGISSEGYKGKGMVMVDN
ncbi:Cytochrome c oxidase subunit 5B, mitochondrial [Vanrija albida]|uniref:Cytochrome c oxidase subunit 5B, mitochondrial n=1 Tax=Vanrija albida TaxID=181172 RepID=A0ABR3Q4G0_9TREE